MRRKVIFLFNRRCNTEILLQIVMINFGSLSDEMQFIFLMTQIILLGLLNKFSGDVLESVISGERRWIILTLKVNNIQFIICNVYGPNRRSEAKDIFSKLLENLAELKENVWNQCLSLEETTMIKTG